MTDEPMLEPRERLLEVLLEETFRRRTRADASAASTLSRRRPWLAVAAALLGLGSVFGVFVLRHQGADHDAPLQDPLPGSQQPWLYDGKPLATPQEWLALQPHITGFTLRHVRPVPGGKGLEVVDGMGSVAGAAAARAIAATVPQLGDQRFQLEHEDPRDFRAWIAFECDDGKRVHGFLRIAEPGVAFLGELRSAGGSEAWRRTMDGLLFPELREILASTSLAELPALPASTRAIRCQPPPNGTFAQHLGRFAELELLEIEPFRFTTTLGNGEPISIPLPEVPSILFELREALPRLRELRIPSFLLHRDEVAAELARLPLLRSLLVDGGFGSVPTPNGGIVRIGGLTPIGMRSLANRIEALEVHGGQIPAELLEPWLDAGALRRLVLVGVEVSPALLTRLVGIPSLGELRLGGASFGDEHVHALGASKLTSLWLDGTSVTEAGLRRLPTSLRSLVLSGQAVGDEISREILTLLPECRIQRLPALGR